MRISTRHSKILGSVQQRKFIREWCSERALFRVCPLPKNFGTSPAAIFVLPIDIEKLIKVEGLFLVKLTGGIDSGFKWLLHHSDASRLQPSFLGIRLMRLQAF
jgi:hypothetical protein